MKQVEMSIVSYKLTIYLFILFIPTMFYHSFNTYVSLREFISISLLLILCVSWQKYVLKLKNLEGGILNSVKARSSSFASLTLFMLCIQVITLKIIVNLLIFIKTFIMNNLIVINYNIHVVIVLLLILIIGLGYFFARYGREYFASIKKIATASIMLFLTIVFINGFSSSHISALQVETTNASMNDLVTASIPFFALFSTWLLITITIYDDSRQKKMDILFKLVTFLLILFSLTFVFNKLISHVLYGETTFISQFFLLAQTIFYILLYKLYAEAAQNLKIISEDKISKSGFSIPVIIIFITIFIVAMVSNMTMLQLQELCASLMFFIVAFFLLFTIRKIDKPLLKFINILFVLFYLFLSIATMSIYMIVIAIITIVYIKIYYVNRVKIIHKIENEFFIKDYNGNKLRFYYRNNNSVTYANYLKTVDKINDITGFLYELGIKDFNLEIENSYEIIHDEYIVIDKTDYHISINAEKPEIKFSNLSSTPKYKLMKYFWENKNINDYEVN